MIQHTSKQMFKPLRTTKSTNSIHQVIKPETAQYLSELEFAKGLIAIKVHQSRPSGNLDVCMDLDGT